MLPIRVIVVASSPDLQAEGIKAAVEAEPSSIMTLLGGGIVAPERVEALLEGLPPLTPCAVILVQGNDEADGHVADTAAGWLDDAEHLVLLHVAVGEDNLEIAARNVSMEALLAAMRGLLDPDGSASIEYVAIDEPRARVNANDSEPPLLAKQPVVLLNAAIDWIHAVLRASTERLFDAPTQETVSVRLAAIADWIENRPPRTPLLASYTDVAQADSALEDALLAADEAEPLARLFRSLLLDPIETRVVLLALGPELDPRYQRWISLLLDDPGRRVGTLGLFAELLGDASAIAGHLAATGRLARWRLFDAKAVAVPAADEPLRIDPPLRRWLLGASRGLTDDPALRMIVRTAAWAGTGLVAAPDACARAERLIARLKLGGASWLLLAGDCSATWRALIEAGSEQTGLQPLRIDLARLAELAEVDAEEAGVRLARLARLTGRPLALDATAFEGNRDFDEAARRFLAGMGAERGHAAIITAEPARIAALLGTARYEIECDVPSGAARVAVLQSAAHGAGAHFTQEAAESLANLFPLQIDGLEQAMRFARAQPLAHDDEDARRSRFITACKDVAAEGASGLAQRIEPSFDLDDLILPADRKGQLEEIISNIHYAPKVLEGWKFRDQLPYGLGVTALFHGPSGTGNTMAALAVAHRLGVQVLRIDLSRLVSKYIGDTEKNIDRIFLEAQHSGAALLIDEADGLLSRRGEVKDAHDRYANLEVAYLLQRMEGHEGLAILTTNLRQNLDPAFLRRLRFIIDFPRPDAAAREAIWRRCLPEESHELDDAMFRQLGRKIELTGGSIRQITLRAAFIAAAAGSQIGLVQIAQACRAEFAKIGLPPVELDLGQERRAA